MSGSTVSNEISVVLKKEFKTLKEIQCLSWQSSCLVFKVIASTKAMVFAAKAHDDLKELEPNVTGPGGQTSA
jgi:hypothetical protein